MKDFRVYGHYNDKGLFYVGATSKKYRHKDSYGRSDKWNAESKNGWYSLILAEGLSKEDASDIESLIVSSYGDSLTNVREGGLYGYSFNHTQATKNKIGRKVYDTVTRTVYPSVTECAKSLGITRQKLKHQLRGTVINKTNIKYYEE